MLDAQLRLPAQNEGMLDHMFELADVPGPIVPGQSLDDRRRHADDRPLEPFIELVDKMLDQQRDILTSFARITSYNVCYTKLLRSA